MLEQLGNINRLRIRTRPSVKALQLSYMASAVLALTLAGCGSSAPVVSGSVLLGAVANAKVAIYALNPDGSAAPEPLATTMTASDGTFSLWQALRYPVLVRVTGGTYEEEATGASGNLSGEVDAVYLSEPTRMVVSPWSNAVVEDARSAGGLTPDNVAAALSRVNALAGNIDVQ